MLLTLSYDGSAFNGFAPQANGRTVAGALSEAVARMDPNAGRIRVASRTDAGVHARAQKASFDTDARIEPRGWLLGLSSFLPPQIAVVRVARVAAGFNPSHAAIGKTYRYHVLRGTCRDPFLHGRSWRVHDRLDIERMQAEADDLLGTHDFVAFRGAADLRKGTVRTIESARWWGPEEAPRSLLFEVRGDRFMYRMVRIIVGTLVDVGRGRVQPGAVRRAIASGRRDDLGMTAPPDGLCLERVHLRDEGSEGWPEHW